ncbi:MAG: ankyrin repeat domain-containing protein [Deferribacteres bacterium]|nr:ankyrin repeat domain-containing protein [candidate division KSB1 bacterium]MCB9502350.1 ankyrin repeat domain-containing protein [Deferribacteres bacterium]
MKKNKAQRDKPGWTGTVFYLIITVGHVWLLYGLVPLAGVIFLSFIGGILIYFGLKKLLKSFLTHPINAVSILGSLALLILGALTLVPAWPDSLLLKTPLGWPILEERARLLDRAMYNDNLPLVRKLAWVGLGDPEPRDSFGRPLIDDAKTPEMLQPLLESGLNPDTRGEGGTTLLMRTHNEEIASVLLSNGADPNARDDNGRTPLMYVYEANPKLVKILAENGAEVNAVDDFGRTVADWLGNSSEVDKLLVNYAHGSIHRNENLNFLSHARQDWLDQIELDSTSSLTPAKISVNPDPLKHGDLAELKIRLTNDTDTKRVVRVEATLNSEALFVGTSHNGKIINPYQAQLDQKIDWPLLALPARSSGFLTMRIFVRDAWDTGDLSVDVRARNVLTYSEEEDLFLNLSQPLSESEYVDGTVASLFLIFSFPLLIMIWAGSWHFLGRKHPFTRVAGRLNAGIFSLLFALITYTLIMETVHLYTNYDKSEAVILDRRFYLKSVTTSGSRTSRSTTTIHQMPIIAARYATPEGDVISSAAASFQFFRENKLGAIVPCWYDRDDPYKLIISREISFLTILAIGLSTSGFLVLAWLAFRRGK